jgi:hypothetical protein
MVRNAHAQHAAGFGQGLENGGQDALAGQLIGCGKTRRPGTDDGDRSSRSAALGNLYLPGIELIGGQALQVTDGHRLIDVAAAAGVFTAVGADAPQDTGQGQILHDDLQGFFVLALAHHLHVTLDIESGRTGQAAGALSAFWMAKAPGMAWA